MNIYLIEAMYILLVIDILFILFFEIPYLCLKFNLNKSKVRMKVICNYLSVHKSDTFIYAKIFVGVTNIIFFLIGISIASFWGLSYSGLGYKGSNIFYAIVLIAFCINWLPFGYIFNRKYFGNKVAFMMALLFILATIGIITTAIIVKIYGIH